MLRSFLGNQILVLLFIPILIGAYFVTNFFMQATEILPSVDLGAWGRFSIYQIQFLPIASGLLILINAIALNFLFNSNEFYEKNTYVIAMFYVLFLSFFSSFYQLSGSLFAHTFVILAFFQLFYLQNNSDGRKRTFNAGLFAGLAVTFQPALVVLFPFLWVMVTRIRPFVFREMILLTLGFILPLSYALVYITYFNQHFDFQWIESSMNAINHKVNFFSVLALFSLATSISLIVLSYKTSKSSIRFKKLHAILKLFLSASIILTLVDYLFFNSIEIMNFSVIIISFIFPYLFFYKSSVLVGKLIFYGTFIFSLVRFFI